MEYGCTYNSVQSYILVIMLLASTLLFLGINLHQVLCDVSWNYNPGCTDPTICGEANMLLAWTRSNATSLWSTQDNTLSGIFYGGTRGKLTVNWTQFNGDEPTAVTVSAVSSLGMSIDSITLRGVNEEEETLPLSAESWEALKHEGGEGNATFIYGTSFATVKVLVNDAEGRMEPLPHLKFNPNVTVVDIAVNISRIPGKTIKSPTSAILHIDMASESKGMVFNDNKKSFDDEVAPALFKYAIFSDNITDSENEKVYALWRPIVYTDGTRKTLSRMSFNRSEDHVTTASSLLTKYYSSDKIIRRSFVISPPDGKTHISEEIFWTFSLGQGEPLTETISLTGLVLTLTIVGLPCLALIIGTLFVLCKRKTPSSPGQGYSAI